LTFAMARLLDLLALVGRYGTQGFIASIALGLALPGLAAAARPLLTACIFTFITLTFARADLAAIRGILRRPAPFALACLWLALAPAVLIGTALAAIGRGSLDPGLVLGLAIIAAAPPILSGPAVAAILGLEPSLLLAATVATTLAAPAISPLLADAVAGAAVPLDPLALALRLAVFIGGAILVALLARRILGEACLAARRRSIDGGGVLVYAVFAIAAMDGVTPAAVARPAVVAGFLAAAFAVSFASLVLTGACLRSMAAGDRLMFGYASGQRNMGLLIAALGANVPETTFLFFALAQFPIYLMPQLLRSIAPFALRAGPAPPVAGP
jgi:BASS family bile acid:Na+ symporter